MRIFITALAMALMLPASAIAVTAEGVIRAQAPQHSSPVVPKRLPTAGTDVAAPDQQAPVSVASRLFTRGTDVAASDQQASLAPAAVEPVRRRVATDGFDWGDAALGAGGTVAVLMLVVGGGILAAHRRRGAHHVAPLS